jgi:hypothetical protein
MSETNDQPLVLEGEVEDAVLYEELARAHAEEAAASRALTEDLQYMETHASSPPAPTGGGHPYGVAYYFTVLENGVEHTYVRELALPHDAVVECVGNTLIIRHDGVSDTFRIGRVRPLEA